MENGTCYKTYNLEKNAAKDTMVTNMLITGINSCKRQTHVRSKTDRAKLSGPIKRRDTVIIILQKPVNNND